MITKIIHIVENTRQLNAVQNIRYSAPYLVMPILKETHLIFLKFLNLLLGPLTKSLTLKGIIFAITYDFCTAQHRSVRCSVRLPWICLNRLYQISWHQEIWNSIFKQIHGDFTLQLDCDCVQKTIPWGVSDVMRGPKSSAKPLLLQKHHD